MSNIFKRYRSEVMLIGDIASFYISLYLALMTRYGIELYPSYLREHIFPFTVLLVIWLLVFYIADLYSYRAFRLRPQNTATFAGAVLVSFAISISIFYIFGAFFELTPKTNLIIFTAFFILTDYVWRYFASLFFRSTKNLKPVLFIARSSLADNLKDHIRQYPESGYSVLEGSENFDDLKNIINQNTGTIIVIDKESLKNQNIVSFIYNLLPSDIEVITLSDFYEETMERIPLSELEDEWFIQEIAGRKKILFGAIKRVTDIIVSLCGLIILSPIILIISILVKATSEGPILYKQKRVGKMGKEFMLSKFRNMYNSIDKNPDAKGTAAIFWTGKNDPRVTPFGRFLRKTHLDEIPQLWNIFKGDMSIVGPRPERPEFMENLKANIPHYFLRHMIKPGLTGWAQVKFHYGGSVEDTKVKIEFDMYYLKHRSFILDLFIIAKTVHKIF